MMTVVMPVWNQAARREKEEELVFRGEQYARAIALFQRKYANAYPPSIDLLVEQRFLRKKYKDPITNDDFVPLAQGQQGNTPGSGSLTASAPGQTATGRSAVPSPADAARGLPGVPGNPGAAPVGAGGTPVGAIVGVTSKSKDKSIRLYKGRDHYNEWAFVYTAPAQATGGPGAPGAAAPGGLPPGGGRRGAPGSTPGPFGPVGPGGPRGNRGAPGPGGGRPGGPGPSPFGQPPSGPPTRSGR